MFTDISVEHYHWVAGGDKTGPDPTTVTDRAHLFLQRLHVLFDQGLILTLRETYTGEVLRFLRRGKIVYHGKHAQTIKQTGVLRVAALLAGVGRADKSTAREFDSTFALATV